MTAHGEKQREGEEELAGLEGEGVVVGEADGEDHQERDNEGAIGGVARFGAEGEEVEDLVAVVPDKPEDGKGAKDAGFREPEKKDIVDWLEEASSARDVAVAVHNGGEVVGADAKKRFVGDHLQTDVGELEASGDTSFVDKWVGKES